MTNPPAPSRRTPDATCASYRIGPVRVELTTSVPDVAQAYHALYADFATNEESHDPEATFGVRVYRKRSHRTGLRHYHIESDVEDVFTVRRLSRVLPHVEGAVNLCIAHYMPRYLMLHAAALVRKGVGVILPGGPAFGKTTLAAALTARGWSYASDEFAMIDPGDGSLAPYPKALSIKTGSFDILKAHGVPVDRAPVFDRADKGAIRLLPARAIRSDAIAKPAPIAVIAFPMLKPDASPACEVMSRAGAVFEMSRRCFNLLRFRSKAIDMLANVTRAATCCRLQTGNIEETCGMLDDIVDHALDARCAQSNTQRPRDAA